MWPSSDQQWKVRHFLNHVLWVTKGTWLVHVEQCSFAILYQNMPLEKKMYFLKFCFFTWPKVEIWCAVGVCKITGLVSFEERDIQTWIRVIICQRYNVTEFMETIHFLCWNCEMVLHKKWPIFQHKSSIMSEQTFSEGARLETLTSKTLLNNKVSWTVRKIRILYSWQMQAVHMIMLLWQLLRSRTWRHLRSELAHCNILQFFYFFILCVEKLL